MIFVSVQQHNVMQSSL